MVITTLPGWRDRVHDAQQTFRMLLDALANPGLPQAIAVPLTPPLGLLPTTAAACLTLLDLDTRVWLQPGLDAAVADWLLFHTGCRFTPSSDEADFAVIWDLASCPLLEAFHWGSPEYPEASTTLLIQIAQFSQGVPMQLSGPGIPDRRSIDPPLPDTFWQQWQRNHQAYPQGVDVFLFSPQQVMGLPRSSACLPSSLNGRRTAWPM